jgi:hypothetical protein
LIALDKPTTRVGTAPQGHKEQDYPRGVWHSYDPRRGQHRMNVYRRAADGPHTRSFYIGHEDTYSAEDRALAEQVALEFRAEYVACRQSGRPFDPTFIDPWK